MLGDTRQKIPYSDYPKIRKRYLSGDTLQQIGDTYGVSRERIRQLMNRMAVKAEQGGASVRAATRREEAEKIRNDMYLERFGCTPSEMDEHRKEYGGVNRRGPPMYAFHQHKFNAKNRGIPFNMKFWEWWTIWRDSGKWENRGTKRGQYVMARYNDCGPYEAGNVRIVTNTENVIEYYERVYGGDYSETLERVLLA